MSELVTLGNKVPTEKEIQEIEERLASMKAAREEAKRSILMTLKSPEMIRALSDDEALMILRAIRVKLSGQRKKHRGSKVSPVLKERLEQALIAGELTLSEMEKTFGLSISYISRVKRELRESGKLVDGEVKNAYHDHQLQSSSAA